jgi:hypothetical protein
MQQQQPSCLAFSGYFGPRYIVASFEAWVQNHLEGALELLKDIGLYQARCGVVFLGVLAPQHCKVSSGCG